VRAIVSAAFTHSVEVYVTVERETEKGDVVVTVCGDNVERWLANNRSNQYRGSSNCSTWTQD
jgi:hypothetical protein